MSTRSVAKAYFDAIAERDVDAMVGFWKPGGREFIRGQVDTTAPDGVRGFFTALFGAVPDLDLQVQDMVVDKGRAAVRWRATGTFCGETPFNGLEPNGAITEEPPCSPVVSQDEPTAAVGDACRQIVMVRSDGEIHGNTPKDVCTCCRMVLSSVTPMNWPAWVPARAALARAK